MGSTPSAHMISGIVADRRRVLCSNAAPFTTDRRMTSPPDFEIDPRYFRNVLGHFPTGVVAITSLDPDGNPVGMAVSSFTSVSLHPPLVAFLPGKSSDTFPVVRDAGRFCANILSAEQQHVCQGMSMKGTEKFVGVSWTPAPSGMPRISQSVAWIDCEIQAIHDAGDHYIVVGRVTAMEIDRADLPLIFFQGGYGWFSPTAP